MAGDDNGKRIGCQRQTYGAGAIGIIDAFRNKMICADSSAGNGMLGMQDFLLKGRAKVETNYIEGELNILTVQKCFNLTKKGIDLRTGRSGGGGVEFLQGLHGRGFWPG